jgi:hypothetical protein
MAPDNQACQCFLGTHFVHEHKIAIASFHMTIESKRISIARNSRPNAI